MGQEPLSQDYVRNLLKRVKLSLNDDDFAETLDAFPDFLNRVHRLDQIDVNNVEPFFIRPRTQGL